jgi:hypothetical protein
MNYKLYFGSSPFVPDRCCGIEATVGAALVTAGAGVVSNIATNKANADINDENLRFSANQAAIQRQFQKDEWTRQFQYQRDEWYKQLDAQSNQQWLNFMRQANYNSPVEQSKRLAQAGLNPSALLGGQGSSGLVSAATGNINAAPSPSVPSGGSVSGASASAPPMIPMKNPLDGSLNAIGSFVRDIAEADKNNKTVQPFVELLGQQVISQKLQNEWQSFENDILNRTKDVQVRQAFKNLKLTGVEISLKRALTGEADSSKLLKDAEKALTLAKKNCSDKEYEQLSFSVEHLLETWTTQQELFKSQTLSNKASASASYASAAYTGALTQTENEFREFRKENLKLVNSYQSFLNDITQNDKIISDATLSERQKATLIEFKEKAIQYGLVTEEMRKRLDIATKENDWWLVNNLLLPVFDRVEQWRSDNINLGKTVVGGMMK